LCSKSQHATSRPQKPLIQDKTNLEYKREVKKTLELVVRECKEEIKRLRNRPSILKGQVAPSMDTELKETVAACQWLTPAGRDRKLYSDAVRTEGRRGKRYRLTITFQKRPLKGGNKKHHKKQRRPHNNESRNQ
jgi:hypothetical protein